MLYGTVTEFCIPSEVNEDCSFALVTLMPSLPPFTLPCFPVWLSFHSIGTSPLHQLTDMSAHIDTFHAFHIRYFPGSAFYPQVPNHVSRTTVSLSIHFILCNVFDRYANYMPDRRILPLVLCSFFPFLLLLFRL